MSKIEKNSAWFTSILERVILCGVKTFLWRTPLTTTWVIPALALGLLTFCQPAIAKTRSIQPLTKKSLKSVKPKAKSKSVYHKPKPAAHKPKRKPTAAKPKVVAKKTKSIAHKPPVLAPKKVSTAFHPVVRPALVRSADGNSSVLDAVRYNVRNAAGINCHVVEIDQSNPGIRLNCVRSEDLGHRSMTFASLVAHHQPLAAITGTFFDMSSGTIICNLVQNGKLITAGHHGNSIAVSKELKPVFLDTANRAGHECDWSKVDFAVSCGPTLVANSRIVLDPPSENFRDPGLFRHASRAGIAITPDKHLLFVTVNHGVTLGKFATMMQDLGAEYAINLDGGSSTGMYVRGHYPSRPARKMTNLLMVSIKPGDPVPKQINLEAVAAPDTFQPNVEEAPEKTPIQVPLPDEVNLKLEEPAETVQPITPILEPTPER